MAEPLRVHFSPTGGATAAVVDAIAQAASTILVQAYTFTSAPIAAALLAAFRRKVAVNIILDASNLSGKYSALTFFQNSGIPTLVDAAHAIAHNKIMILDGSVVLTGSFNFTTNAEYHNAENLLAIQDAGLAALYAANWHLHAAHSHPPGPPALKLGTKQPDSPGQIQIGTK